MRTKTGVVTSAKMTGTVTVTVRRFVYHPVYKKRYPRSKKYLADPNGHDVMEGDKVVITECRPLSKNKCFQVTEVVEQAPRVSEVQEEKEIEQAVNPEKEAPPPPKKTEEDKKEEASDKTEAAEKEEETPDAAEDETKEDSPAQE